MRLAQAVFSTSSIVLVTVLAGCSDSPQEAPLEECPDNEVIVTVSGGVTPTFSWTPRCGMASLDVFPSNGGASVWVLFSGEQAGTNPFRSGIVYGQAPPSALEVTGPMPLSAGTEYTVLIYRCAGDASGCDALLQAGAATFRP
jgi:hypothetical protein